MTMRCTPAAVALRCTASLQLRVMTLLCWFGASRMPHGALCDSSLLRTHHIQCCVWMYAQPRSRVHEINRACAILELRDRGQVSQAGIESLCVRDALLAGLRPPRSARTTFGGPVPATGADHPTCR